MNKHIELSFDIRGNLLPYGRTEITLEIFETFFVKNFSESNQQRTEIYNEWLHL